MHDSAILHIGPEKTGSTAIQAWIVAHRAALRDAGVATPFCGRRGEALAVVRAAAAPDRRFGLHRDQPALHRMWRLVAPLHRMAVARRLAAGQGRLLLSSERLESQLRHPDEIAALRQLVQPHAREVTIVVYLRRPSDAAASMRSTLLRNGAVHAPLLPDPGHALARGWWDHATLLARWQTAWPEARILPRLFLPADLVGGDVVQDFIATAGLPAFPLAAGALRNASLSAEAQSFLLAANRAARNGATIDRQGIVRRLDRRGSGPGARAGAAQVAAFDAVYAAGQEQVRARWFPDRPALFPPVPPLPARRGDLDDEAYARVMVWVTGQPGRALAGRDPVAAIAAEPLLRRIGQG